MFEVAVAEQLHKYWAVPTGTSFNDHPSKSAVSVTEELENVYVTSPFGTAGAELPLVLLL